MFRFIFSKLSKKEKGEFGFTLIELLVVIAIIGVLASVVLASLSGARRKSRDARRITDIKQIQLALELYFDGVGNSKYPAASTSCSATTANGLEALSSNGYIPQVPHDPLGTASTLCYRYATLTVANDRTTYHLGATLEDTTNKALTNDKDQPIAVSDWTNDFDGTSPVTTAGGPCGTNPLSGTEVETCYDVTP